MTRNVDIDEKRQELEILYNTHPSMRLLYQILIGGTIGTFLAVVSARALAPSRLPQLTFPQQVKTNDTATHTSRTNDAEEFQQLGCPLR